jgi:SfnB family sulfur acquisition oxidoreductase
MGTVSQLHDHARPPARRIESEDEAITVARSLAADFAQRASDRDVNRLLPHDEIDALSQSGLLGITVPAEFEGLDISNAVLAEIIAIVAGGDPSIGQFPQGHFRVLETLRINAREEQKSLFFARALAGERFGIATADTVASDANKVRLKADGRGYRLASAKFQSSGVLFADWIAIPAIAPADRLTMSLVPRDADGIQVIDDWDGFGQRTTGGGTTILRNVRVDPEAVVYLETGAGGATIGCVSKLVHAGVDLGIARAAFAEALDLVKKGSTHTAGDRQKAMDSPFTVARVGQIAIGIEAAAAMIERAGRKLDAAQISPTETHIDNANLVVAMAAAQAAAIALEASNGLFELAGTSSTRIGLNLDRHWRNARTHTLPDPAQRTYYAIGDYHLNGMAPPKDRMT